MYLSGTLQVVIRRLQDKSIPLIWFETEVRTRGEERFRTVMTNPDHPARNYKFPYKIAQEEGFVLGFTDDFYADRMKNNQTVGIIIREGRIISDKTNRKRNSHLPNLDMMIQYPDGRLEVCGCTEYTAEELLEKGALNVFSFGPILIRDGEIDEKMYSSSYRDLEPRQALGMIEPGHYLLMSFQGRKEKDSKGTMLQRVAEMMKERGVTQALNLDGGNTMALVFRGRMLNKEAKYQNRRFVRAVTSLIGVGKTKIP
jgi:exopolysaccharide biosynthesis protein